MSCKQTKEIILLVVMLAVLLPIREMSEVDPAAIGLWTDACPCPIPCTCWRTKRAGTKQCLNVQVFFLSQGAHRGRELQPMAIVLINISGRDFGSPVPLIAYVDNSIDDEGLDFATALLAARGLMPSAGVHRKKLTSRVTKDSITVGVGDILDYKIATTTHSAPERNVKDHLYPWLTEPEQWVAEGVRLHLAEIDASYRGTNALAARLK